MFHPSRSPVAIIGAGPYGVSIAAHLRSAGIDFRILGKPLDRWRRHMPKGMFLKSEGRASNLSDPTASYTLARYCTEKGLPYKETGSTIPLALFTEYALWFQRSLAPNVEEAMVTEVDTSPGGFDLHLSDGTTMRAAQVVVATGLEHTACVPGELASLPPELLSHSAEHHDLSRFRGKDVTVIGGGQSALEAAALLAEEGAWVRLLVRKPSLLWNRLQRTGHRSVYQRLRHPSSNLGLGLRLWFYCTAPMLFRCLPQRVRLDRARLELGPSGAWWLKDRVDGHVQILLNHCTRSAEARGGRAVLTVAGEDGRVSHLSTDHVIAATGYRFDLQRLPFLSQQLKSQVRSVEQQPVLSPSFESSVPGLYFTGLASASTFGPAMRFLHGAECTARCVSRHIALSRRRYRAPLAFQFAKAGF